MPGRIAIIRISPTCNVVRQHFRPSSKIYKDKNSTPFQHLTEKTCFPIGKFVSLTKIANEVKL
jgi:hypothetical protein